MEGSPKILIVVAVVLVIFIGIISYLAFLDRKIAKIEKKLKDHTGDPS
jgi:CcmD family protein